MNVNTKGGTGSGQDLIPEGIVASSQDYIVSGTSSHKNTGTEEHFCTFLKCYIYIVQAEVITLLM